MSILQNHHFLPSQTTNHHPCCFCQIYICLLTKIKNCEVKRNDRHNTSRVNPLASHKDQYLDYQKNTKQIFLCLKTSIMDCDHLVTLFILYQKSSKRKLCLIHYNTESQLWSTQQKILLPSISLTKAGEAEQTAFLYSEQHVQLKL